jgi:O-antigen ligase
MSHRNLEQLDKSELIKLVKSLQNQLTQRASAATFFRNLALLCLGATIILIPFRSRAAVLARPVPPIYRDYTDFVLYHSDIFLIATLIFWLVSLILKPRRLTLGPLFLSLPVAAITVFGFLSVFSSADSPLSLYHSIRLLLLDGLYLFVINEILSFKLIFLPVGIQVFIQAAVGVAQSLKQASVGLQTLGEHELNPTWARISIVGAEGSRFLRAYGLSDHPNILGGCLAFGVLMILIWYLQSKHKILIAGLFALGAMGLFLTFSRSAWFALFSGFLLVMALSLKTQGRQEIQKWGSLAGATLIVIIPFLWYHAGHVGLRLNWGNSFSEAPHENRAVRERALLNRAGKEIFAGDPLTGVGLGAFPQALKEARPDWPLDYQPVHLVVLEAAAEIGLFGALSYALAVITPWIALGLALFGRIPLRFSMPLIGATSLLLAVTCVGFFDYYTWLLVPGRLWAWLVWGLWGAFYNIAQQGERDD